MSFGLGWGQAFLWYKRRWYRALKREKKVKPNLRCGEKVQWRLEAPLGQMLRTGSSDPDSRGNTRETLSHSGRAQWGFAQGH